MVKKYRWDVTLDKKIWISHGVAPGLICTDKFGLGPYDTEEDARNDAPKVGDIRISDSMPYKKAKVIKVEIKSFEQRFNW